MTISSYSQRRIYIFSRNERYVSLSNTFRLFCNGGFATGAAIAWIILGTAIYLIAVYSSFGLEIGLQQKFLVVKNLTESNTIIELNLRQRQTEFTKNNQDILESMQKISDMRYVLPTDTAVSRVDISHQRSQ